MSDPNQYGGGDQNQIDPNTGEPYVTGQNQASQQAPGGNGLAAFDASTNYTPGSGYQYNYGNTKNGLGYRTGQLEDLGNNAQQRQGPAADYAQANADYGQYQGSVGKQNDYTNYLHDVMMGTAGPSAAETQMSAGVDQSIAAQMAMAHSAQGGGQAFMAAQRQAAQQGAAMQAQATQQGATMRAQEQAQARQAYGGQLGLMANQSLQARGQSAQMGQYNAGLQMQQRGLNDQMQLGTEGLENQATLGQLSAQTQYDTNMIGQDEYNAQQRGKLFAGTVGAAGAAAQMMSDVHSKDRIRDLEEENNAFRDVLDAGSRQLSPEQRMELQPPRPPPPTPEKAAQMADLYANAARTMRNASLYGRTVGRPVMSHQASDDALNASGEYADRVLDDAGWSGSPNDPNTGRVGGGAPSPDEAAQQMAAIQAQARQTMAARMRPGVTLDAGTQSVLGNTQLMSSEDEKNVIGGLSMTDDPSKGLVTEPGGGGDDGGGGIGGGIAGIGSIASAFANSYNGKPVSGAPLKKPSDAKNLMANKRSFDMTKAMESTMVPGGPGQPPPVPEITSGPAVPGEYSPASIADAGHDYSAEFADSLPSPSAEDMTSDERAKKTKETLGPRGRAPDEGNDPERQSPISAFLDPLHGYSYTYKRPERDGAGVHYGVMAQDLEKSPMGASMVTSTPAGKMVDTRKAAMGGLAALADHERRLRAVEGAR